MRTRKILNSKIFILILSLFFRYLSTINKCLNGIFISKCALYTAATRTWGDSACVTVHLPRLRWYAVVTSFRRTGHETHPATLSRH